MKDDACIHQWLLSRCSASTDQNSYSFKWKWNNPGTIRVFSSPCNVCFSFPAKGFHNLWLHSEAEVWIEKCWFCNFLRPATTGAVTIQSKPVVGTSFLSSIAFLQRHFTPILSPANCWQPIAGIASWGLVETLARYFWCRRISPNLLYGSSLRIIKYYKKSIQAIGCQILSLSICSLFPPKGQEPK